MLSKEHLKKKLTDKARKQILQPLKDKYRKVDTHDMEQAFEKLFDVIAQAVVEEIKENAVIYLENTLTGNGTANVATPAGPATGTVSVTIAAGQKIGGIK